MAGTRFPVLGSGLNAFATNCNDYGRAIFFVHSTDLIASSMPTLYTTVQISLVAQLQNGLDRSGQINLYKEVAPFIYRASLGKGRGPV